MTIVSTTKSGPLTGLNSYPKDRSEKLGISATLMHWLIPSNKKYSYYLFNEKHATPTRILVPRNPVSTHSIDHFLIRAAPTLAYVNVSPKKKVCSHVGTEHGNHCLCTAGYSGQICFPFSLLIESRGFCFSPSALSVQSCSRKSAFTPQCTLR